jgi:hypothetical protein
MELGGEEEEFVWKFKNLHSSAIWAFAGEN